MNMAKNGQKWVFSQNLIWSVNYLSQKIQTGGGTFCYILKIDSKFPKLYVPSFGSMYFVPLVHFSYAKVSAFSLYKLPIWAYMGLMTSSYNL